MLSIIFHPFQTGLMADYKNLNSQTKEKIVITKEFLWQSCRKKFDLTKDPKYWFLIISE